MELYRVAFIGHRMILRNYDLEDRIEDIVKDLLRTKEYVELYLGRNGDFDISAASAIKRAQKALGHENSSLILVQPQPMKDDCHYSEFYDELLYPIPGTVHPKRRITERNKWLVDNTDLVICYVEKGRTGGALSTLKYGEKQGIDIIFLANIDI